MNELSKDKAFSILFIADYERASVKWQQFEDTIINNLLGRSAVLGGSWMKFTNLPPIAVSVVDKAETKEQAFKYLQESRYDVVIVNNALDGSPIGGGMLKRFRQYHPNTLFIPLLDISQKKGSVKRDGSVCTGEGLLNIFNAGFYNGLYKNSLNVGVMINIIHAGGRPKENAYAYYGFDRALIGSAENEGSVTSAVGKKEAVKVSQNSSNSASIVEKEPVRVSKQDAQDTFVFKRKGEGVGVRKPTVAEPVKDEKNQSGEIGAVGEPVSVNNSNNNNDDEKPLNSRQRRRLERERKKREREETLLSSGNDQEVVYTSAVAEQGQPESADGIVEDSRVEERERSEYAESNGNLGSEPSVSSPVGSSMSAGEIAAYSENPQVNEMMEMMKRRGCMNSSLVVPGALYGRVVYGNGNTVLIELDKSLEQVGLNFADIFNVPVVIPYTKFGDLDN